PRPIVCPACSEAVAPDEAESVQCGRCSGSIPVPPHVREAIARNRIKALKASRAVEQARTLLAQRNARTTNQMLALAGVPALVASAVACVALALQYNRGTLSPLNVVLIAAGVAMLIAAPFWLVAMRLASRTTSRTLSFELGAAMSRGSSRLPACRCCAAILPAHDDSTLLVLCLNCNAQNLYLGLGGEPS